ncbi:potassium transporter TrkG [Marispirochaeta sp.]|uniref:TrkH family potassium uptake protein n=1 Tax=Marispirochaeta sp. TaxID=2038653 RepID=UPI0029C87BE3|nr:potassium transporter TrkG [Marispirochaeta sp.]
MHRLFSSQQFTLLAFFIVVILTGSILLVQPAAWNGSGQLSYLDAVFTSTSAVCVTGLITVDTAQYSFFGKLVIMALIQIGGLGIMSFATIFLITPSLRLSLSHQQIIQNYFVETVEHRDRHIISSIVLFTLIAEAVGAILLYTRFSAMQDSGTVFNDSVLLTSVFHSVSAFCNAGFSLFSNSLENYPEDKLVLVTVMSLIVLGGLGFVVFNDLIKRLRGKNRNLTLHSRMVLFMTVTLIFGGAVVYYFLEGHGTMAGLQEHQKWVNSFFQSVTTRTAGFNTIPQGDLSSPAKAFTLFLMFTGGAPGSIAGGVKVTTMLIVLTVIFRGTFKEGTLNIGKRQIPAETVSNAHLFILRAVTLVACGAFALTISELMIADSSWSYMDVLFEVFSAFGTVGLSTGVTPTLSSAGKMVIIFVMFAGRVGLISVTLTQSPENLRHNIEYVTERVMIG